MLFTLVNIDVACFCRCVIFQCVFFPVVAVLRSLYIDHGYRGLLAPGLSQTIHWFLDTLTVTYLLKLYLMLNYNYNSIVWFQDLLLLFLLVKHVKCTKQLNAE